MDEELINAEHELHNSNGLPQGVKIATYTDRRDLQTAMEKLEAAGFPMQTIFVVNSGMRQVDFFMGKLSYPRIALSAALSGIFFGLFFAAIVGLVTGGSMLNAALSYIPIAVAFTVIYSVINFSRQKKKLNGGYMMRSVNVPETIELHTLPMTAAQAQQILGVKRMAQTPRTPEFFLPHQASAQPRQDVAPQQFVPEQPAPSQPEQAAAVRAPETKPYVPQRASDEPAAQHFGRLIEDPEEYAAMIRQEPERPSTNERVEEIRSQQSTGRYGLRVESQEEFEAAIRKPEDEK